MRVLFIMNGPAAESKEGPGVSGGPMMLLKTAENWSESGIEVALLTTRSGLQLASGVGFRGRTFEAGNFKWTGTPALVHLARLLLSADGKLEREHFDIVYSQCEHLYDVLPAWLLKRKLGAVWAAQVHFLPPPLGSRNTSKLHELTYFINHMLGARIIMSLADCILAVSESTKRAYRLRFPKSARDMVAVPGGLDYDLIRRSLPADEFRSDAIFMKRLHPAKGVFDLVEIWRDVVRKLPDSKLRVIGGGEDPILARLSGEIAESGLTANIELVGPVYDQSLKFRMMKSSKLMILPSYEENWAIVVGEALAGGLPVIAYRLPELVEVWGSAVTWIQPGDTKAFADKVREFLTTPEVLNAQRGRSVDCPMLYDWHRVAQIELEYVLRFVKSKGTDSQDDCAVSH